MVTSFTEPDLSHSDAVGSQSKASGRDSRSLQWLASMLLPLLLVPVSFLTWDRATYPYGTLCGLVFLVFSITCLITDCRWQKIYNWATYPALVWGILINVTALILPVTLADSHRMPDVAENLSFVGPPFLGAIGIGESVLGATVFLIGASIISGITRFGGGDIKMMTVIGAYLGAKEAFFAVVLAYLLAGTLSLAMLLFRVGIFRLSGFVLIWLGHTLLPLAFSKPELGEAEFLAQPIPIGGFLAAGAIIAMGPLSLWPR